MVCVCIIMGTLRVVTARALVTLSSFFTSHSMSVRQLHHLHGHASHERYTVSNVEGQEINLHKFYLSGNRTPNHRLGRQVLLPARLLHHFYYHLLSISLCENSMVFHVLTHICYQSWQYVGICEVCTLLQPQQSTTSCSKFWFEGSSNNWVKIL